MACGTGIVARLTADRVAPSGSVVGLDANEAMLTVARAQPAPTGAQLVEKMTPELLKQTKSEVFRKLQTLNKPRWFP
ncbi:MAG TPA: methyltransferase domain-containing protein [Candidatus Binatia bacterium]|nr:methyltransferase domain-containing protein [Candidatus Binatia bacterium]